MRAPLPWARCRARAAGTLGASAVGCVCQRWCRGSSPGVLGDTVTPYLRARVPAPLWGLETTDGTESHTPVWPPAHACAHAGVQLGPAGGSQRLTVKRSSCAWTALAAPGCRPPSLPVRVSHRPVLVASREGRAVGSPWPVRVTALLLLCSGATMKWKSGGTGTQALRCPDSRSGD